MDSSRQTFGDQNRVAVKRARDCWNRGDLSGYMQLYDPDVELHGYAGVERGLENVQRFYEEFWKAFPGSQLIFEDIISSEDKVVCRFVIEATHAGTFQGLPATGKKIAMPGMTILRFAEAKCVERWSQADSLGLLVQLGALPAPK
jgi:steroid delta-isomerase-like uncharacterized protein